MKITLCGSTKFKKFFERVNLWLTLKGNLVYSVAVCSHADGVPLTKEMKELLDCIHLQKIFQSDSIFVLDVNGYIGESTQKEIDYAQTCGKGIVYLSRCYSGYLEFEKILFEDTALEEVT